jgi:tetratricopeptide (TPR) repeat protein
MLAYFDPTDLDTMRDDDLWEIWSSIKNGAQNSAQLLGFDENALLSIERAAHGYYAAKKYGMAANLFGFLLRLNVKRASAWRGLGACAHALRQYELAVHVFRLAVECDPGDQICQIFLGEALCQTGQLEEGVAKLQEVLESDAQSSLVTPYRQRAQAIVDADGGIPSREALQKQGLKALAAAVGASPDGGVLEYDEDRDIQWSDMQKNPELMSVLGDVKKAVADGSLTMAEVGGFTDNELDGAYAVACKYVEVSQLTEALQLLGFLIMLDPYKGRYYQLMGISLQQLRQYESADRFYKMALRLDDDNPMSMIYRGECKIMGGDIDLGLEFIKKGMDCASGNTQAHQELIARGKTLITQFSAT